MVAFPAKLPVNVVPVIDPPNVAPAFTEMPANVCNPVNVFAPSDAPVTAPTAPLKLNTPVFEMLTVPVLAVTEIPVPATARVTPALVIVTAPVAPDTDIPSPATAAETPCTAPVRPLKEVTTLSDDARPDTDTVIPPARVKVIPMFVPALRVIPPVIPFSADTPCTAPVRPLYLVTASIRTCDCNAVNPTT